MRQSAGVEAASTSAMVRPAGRAGSAAKAAK